MVLVIFGQPHSGKTTLANKISQSGEWIGIDGDVLREIFKNQDYSRAGRIKNLEKASDISAFLSHSGKNVVCSLVYPYLESRNYLRSLIPGSKWVYLTYDGGRGREKFHVSDFDIPREDEALILDTTQLSVDDCISKITNFIV